MQQTLIDLFELRATSTEYTYAAPAREVVARQSIDLEVDWDNEDSNEESHDWQSSSADSSPGVSVESWNRARGWCAD